MEAADEKHKVKNEYKRVQNGTRKQLSSLAEIRRDEMKTQNMKGRGDLKNVTQRKRKFWIKCEEFKQQTLAKIRRPSRHRKRKSQYNRTKIFRTVCKKFYRLLR